MPAHCDYVLPVGIDFGEAFQKRQENVTIDRGRDVCIEEFSVVFEKRYRFALLELVGELYADPVVCNLLVVGFGARSPIQRLLKGRSDRVDR